MSAVLRCRTSVTQYVRLLEEATEYSYPRAEFGL